MEAGMSSTPARQDGARADYGQDAPIVLRRLLLAGGVAVVSGYGALLLAPDALSEGLRGAADALAKVGLGCLAAAALLVWGSRVTKLRMRDRLLDALPWRGDERVLDVGCGHGLLLIGAARRAGQGHAVGVDVWRHYDQADNRADVPRRNAQIEGVADRVEVRDGDARELPFPDASFDTVVSSLAIHNIESREERVRAVQEMARVLKPGGHVGVVDIYRSREYAKTLRELGFEDVTWRLAGHSVVPAFRVTGRKPQAA